MTLVEWFSIFGSLASAGAIIVSVAVFWKQRINELKTIKNNKFNELEALKVIIYDEVRENYIWLVKTLRFCHCVWDKKIRHLTYNDVGHLPFIEYTNLNGLLEQMPFRKLSTRVMDNHLLDVSRIDDNLIKMLIQVRYCTHHYNEAIINGFNNFAKSNPNILQLSSYIDGMKEFITNFENGSEEIMKYCRQQ